MKPKMRTLKNGVKVVMMPLTGMRSVSIEVGVAIGSKYEDIKEYGLSHFLEHMAFKGTTRRPTAEVINREIDVRGASYNAGTTQESTVYYITTIKENLEWAIDILGDILVDPLIEPKEVEKEREVIVEEIKMYQDNPRMGLADDFYEFCLGGKGKGCWDVAGKVEEVRNYTRKDLCGYRNKMLNPKRMVITISGDVPEMEKVEFMVENAFGGIVEKENQLPAVKIDWNHTMEKGMAKTSEQAHFCLGVEGIKRTDARKQALKVLEIILAGNSSSRLFQEIRENRGWAYYVDSIGQCWQETGIVGFQSGVRKDKLDLAVELVKKILIDAHNSINEEELLRAKQYLRGRVSLAMDRSEFWSEYLDQKLLIEGHLGDLEADLMEIESVKLLEVKDLCVDLFGPSKYRLLTIRG